MLTLDEYQQRVALTLEGLVPVAWLGRLQRCANERRPQLAELWPERHELDACVEVLVMADVLAAGGAARTEREREARGRSLAALARAIVMLALAPGGVKFLGTWWRVEPVTFGPGDTCIHLVSSPAEGLRHAEGSSAPSTTPTVNQAALDAMKRAILDGLGG